MVGWVRFEFQALGRPARLLASPSCGAGEMMSLCSSKARLSSCDSSRILVGLCSSRSSFAITRQGREGNDWGLPSCMAVEFEHVEAIIKNAKLRQRQSFGEDSEEPVAAVQIAFFRRFEVDSAYAFLG